MSKVMSLNEAIGLIQDGDWRCHIGNLYVRCAGGNYGWH